MNDYMLTDDGENLEVKPVRKYKASLLGWSMCVLFMGTALILIVSGVFTLIPVGVIEGLSYQDYLDKIYRIHDVTLVTVLICVVFVLLIRILWMTTLKTSAKVRFYEENGVHLVEKFNKSSGVWEKADVVGAKVIVLQRVTFIVSIILAISAPVVVFLINFSVGGF